MVDVDVFPERGAKVTGLGGAIPVLGDKISENFLSLCCPHHPSMSIHTQNIAIHLTSTTHHVISNCSLSRQYHFEFRLANSITSDAY